AARATLSATSSPADLKKLLTVSPPTDRTERFAYDLNGKLRFEVDAAGYFKETRYNALGQVVLTASYQTPKVFAEATLATDLAGQVSVQGADTVLENRPRITQYVYDVQGNLLSRTEPMLGKQAYTYDALGRKLSMTNALGKTWTYRYDAAGRNIAENSPNFTAYQDAASSAMGGWGGGAATTLITTLTYDALGNLTSRTEGAFTVQARTTSYEYDRVGRQKATIMPTTMVYDASAPADGNGRTEVAVTPVIRVWYDALGNAVVNQGADGAISQKSYDQMGRVAYDIDALGYATGYQRNAFGEATALTRYNLKQSVNSWGGAEQVGRDLLRDPANDRTIVTRYDLRGRAVKVIEPATTIYDARAIGNRYPTAARTTETTYNGFGDVTVQQTYGADADGKRLTEAAATRYYYDARGLKAAQVNVLSDTPALRAGYLSTFVYNDIGKLTRQTDFSAAVTLTDTGYAPGVATDRLNRNTQYAYDKNGNLTSETKVGVDYVTAAGAAVVNGSLVTRYAYDALDRQVSVTNALNQVTNTYYDELGRISAVSKQLTATTAQLTEFKRDVHGNALLRIDYAQAAATASGGSVT
ncbi:MAG TPA: hypothetical protein VN089_04585, partial [Duganella sp.]|nr:hypothetical protein [Duganella sp.]